jgi:Tfp pilus assembly protein PilF
MRALSQDPAQRFDDPLQLADAMSARTSSDRRRSPAKVLMAGTIAVAVIAAVVVLYSRRPHAAARGMTTDSLALALYNRGRASQGIRSSAVVAQAFEDFSGAVGRDSSFALAWAGLGRTVQMALLRGHPIRQLSRDSLLRLALFASQRAVSLDSTHAEVWLVRARVMESVDPTSRRGVLQDVRRALAIDSSSGEAWYALARARDEILDSAGARIAYQRAVKLAPTNTDLLAFFSFHGLWTNSFAEGLKWADSALAIDPTLGLAHEAAADLSIEIRDWPLAERQSEVYRRLSTGADRASALGGAARLSALRGDVAAARRFALAAEKTVDSATLTKHQASYLGLAFAAIGDTARAVKWLASFSPRADVHYQLHLHRDPGLAWVREPKYRWLLAEPDTTSR